MTETLDKKLSDLAGTYADSVMDDIKTIETEYWASIHSLAGHGYKSKVEQYADIEKVSELGLALVSLVRSHRKLSDVRWGK